MNQASKDRLEVGRRQTLPPIPLPKEIRSLFEFCNSTKFKAMNDESLAKHIQKVRAKIELITPWPCLYWYSFLPHAGSIRNVSLPSTYNRILSHLHANPQAKILDMGCMIGHDSRILLQDGVRPNQIICSDLFPKLFDLGNEMFADSMQDDHLYGSQWKVIDIFDQSMVDTLRIPGGFYAIYSAKFIQLFTKTQQVQVVATLKSLLSKESGATLFGTDCGRKEGQEGLFDLKSGMKMGPISSVDATEANEMFHHSCSSFRRLMTEGETSDWNVEVEFKETDHPKGDGEIVCDPEHSRSLCEHLQWSVIRK
jgi:hypothetical protein